VFVGCTISPSAEISKIASANGLGLFLDRFFAA
jgi:hypothetical protein